MRQRPEVLFTIAGMPLRAREHLAGRQFEQQRGHQAVVFLVGSVADARDQAVRVVGKQNVGVVDEVDREHGRAAQQQPGLRLLEAEILKRQRDDGVAGPMRPGAVGPHVGERRGSQRAGQQSKGERQGASNRR